MSINHDAKNVPPRSSVSAQTDLLARDEYDRCRRLFEHGRGGVGEEQLVDQAAAYTHDDECGTAELHVGEERVVGGRGSVRDGARWYVDTGEPYIGAHAGRPGLPAA